jgi:geranylgeranyl diphosphate synthase type II
VPDTSIQHPPLEITETAALIEQELQSQLGQLQLPEHLADATTYAVMNGGKRVRPTLTLLCCEAVGGSRQDAIAAAIAVEYVHCFSLVHDDLPAIDNDELRRGKPTLHIHAGEAMAVLAGDLLLPLSFSQLTGANYPPEQQVRLTELLATATRDMVVGQVYDTLGGLPKELDDRTCIEEIHRNKTGALIRCACQMGAICGGASTKAYDAIDAFGEATGLMFQIVDDLIDLHGCEDHVGKATGKDARDGKVTYPGTIGVEASKRVVKELHDKAESALEVLGDTAETLCSFNVWLAHRTR